jgi:hypothetical protein
MTQFLADEDGLIKTILTNRYVKGITYFYKTKILPLNM